MTGPLYLFSRFRKKTASGTILFKSAINNQANGVGEALYTTEIAIPLRYEKWLLLA